MASGGKWARLKNSYCQCLMPSWVVDSLNLELGDSTLSIPRTCALWFGLRT